MSSSTNSDLHYKCYDIFPINWPATSIDDQRSDCGILLEIWRTGGLVHSGIPIPEGLIELAPQGYAIQGQVVSCEPDEHYGFLVQVSVDPNDNWFPDSYCPVYLRDDYPCRN